MSWECPHQYDDRCDRLNAPCRPTAKGCVLYNQRALLGLDQQESAMKNEDEKNERPQMTPETTAAEVVIRYPYLRPTMERLGLDYCCGGNRTLTEAARHAGVPLETALSTLRAVAPPTASAAPATDWTAASLTQLADHILDTHHVFTKRQLERIQMLLDKVTAAHGAAHGALLDKLGLLFSDLRDELESHLMKEEQILFPAIKAIDAFCSGRGPLPVVHCGSVAYPIRQMEVEHDGAGNALAEMRRLTDGYRLPEDACPTFAALYEALPELEDDLHQHIHLENNILFPASIRQEQSIAPCGCQ